MSKIKKVLGIMLGVMLLCSQALLVSAAPVDTVNMERRYLENGELYRNRHF